MENNPQRYQQGSNPCVGIRLAFEIKQKAGL